jgi:hypothetical protein
MPTPVIGSILLARAAPGRLLPGMSAFGCPPAWAGSWMRSSRSVGEHQAAGTRLPIAQWARRLAQRRPSVGERIGDLVGMRGPQHDVVGVPGGHELKADGEPS